MCKIFEKCYHIIEPKNKILKNLQLCDCKNKCLFSQYLLTTKNIKVPVFKESSSKSCK